MLVDDRAENLFSLKALLHEMEAQVHCALTGQQALALMIEHEFSLAILDVQMPEMDGFELAELMRGTTRTRDIPIIFVTAAAKNLDFVFKGYESGAVDFLYKPIDPILLKCKVRVFLELAEQKQELKNKVKELESAKAQADIARDHAEKANNLKSQFLANMSHEIRTPLGALMGFAELLKYSDNPEDRSRYIEVILRNGKSLVQLIDEILDLSKIESGYLDIETAIVSPRAALQEVLDLLTPLAAQKGIALTLDAQGIPERIATDPLRLRQILTNVIGNAVKFTEKGTVHVTTSWKERMGELPLLSVHVEDTGIGISETKMARMFQPFSQADSSITRKFGGTGLGLVLSKKLAQHLGGDVSLKESKVGVGSKFEVKIEDRFQNLKLKLLTSNQDKSAISRASDQSKPLSDMKILVVDDSVDNQFLIQRILTQNGASVETADNGKDGVIKALANHFNVILMDIQMPICDGFQATKLLRNQMYQGTIIALTANAMREEREKCLNSGFTEYLSKPIDRQLLIRTIQTLGKINLPSEINSI